MPKIHVEGFGDIEVDNLFTSTDDKQPKILSLGLNNQVFENTGKLDLIGFNSDGRFIATLMLPTTNTNLFAWGFLEFHETIKLHGNRKPEISWSNGNQQFSLFWEEAYLKVVDNPIELRYKYILDQGGTFSLEKLEAGSLTQARAMLRHLREFSDLIKFKQAQKGGRRKGKRTKETRSKYNKILNQRRAWYRTDKEFCEKYNCSPSSLYRARKWKKEERP